MRASTLACLPLVASVMLAGCGESVIDAATVEKGIRDALSASIRSQVATVTCPKDVTAKVGATFKCIITGADGSKSFSVARQTKDDGTVMIESSLLDSAKVQTRAARSLSKTSNTKVEVVCPKIVSGEKGTKFSCQATSSADSRKIPLMVADEQGNVVAAS